MKANEQAEVFLNEIERRFFQTHGMDDGAALRKAIREMIPLVELIEVAAAANELNDNCIPCMIDGVTDRDWVYTNDAERLNKALMELDRKTLNL